MKLRVAAAARAIAVLRNHVTEFAGLVALVHGDSHACRVDYPLWDRVNLRYFPNFQRIETFGSPCVTITRYQ